LFLLDVVVEIEDKAICIDNINLDEDKWSEWNCFVSRQCASTAIWI